MKNEQDDVAVMLRESARDFAEREKDFTAFRARMGQAPGYDTERFRKMQDLGWRSALVREELGGAGMGLREVAAIAEELGRGLSGDVLLATSVLPVQLLQDRLTLPTAVPLLKAIAEGSAVAALAWQERAESIATDAMETIADRSASGFELTGVKRWVAGGQVATVFLVSARHEGGIAVFAVPREAGGVAVDTAWQVDGIASPVLRLDKVQLAADALLVDCSQGVATISRAQDAAAVAASAELLGVTNVAFDMTIDYLKTRVQYDKVIGTFQALQHKAVDLLVQRELAAAVLEEAVAAFDEDGGSEAERARLASRCKARCSDAALRITRECIQLHGAIGYTHEYDLGLYVKRALVLAAWLGNGAQHRARFQTLAPASKTHGDAHA